MLRKFGKCPFQEFVCVEVRPHLFTTYCSLMIVFFLLKPQWQTLIPSEKNCTNMNEHLDRKLIYKKGLYASIKIFAVTLEIALLIIWESNDEMTTVMDIWAFL